MRRSLAALAVPVTLATAMLASACDLPEDLDDEMSEAADADADADADTDADENADADSGTDPGGNDASGGADDDGMDPADDDTGFDNDPEQALGALAGMWYACHAGDVYYDVFFNAGNAITIRDGEGAEAPGTYSTTAQSLTLSVPSLGFTESSGDGWVEFDHLVQFATPSLVCNAVALDHTAPNDPSIVSCPSIKYIPEVGWENNEFHFGAGGDVYRRRWTELSGANDTLYGRIYGVYVTVGDRVLMVFAGDHDGEQYLTGTVTDDGLYIDELEPDKGACK